MKIVLMIDNATIPMRASEKPAGLDLYSNINIDIKVGSIKKLNTGICISLPENYSLVSKGLLVKIIQEKLS